jgi:hypothetical protein
MTNAIRDMIRTSDELHAIANDTTMPDQVRNDAVSEAMRLDWECGKRMAKLARQNRK